MYIGQLILFMLHDVVCVGGCCQTIDKSHTGMITSIEAYDVRFIDVITKKLYVASIEDVAGVEYLN